jgi:hypothetical protein
MADSYQEMPILYQAELDRMVRRGSLAPSV